MTSQIPVDLFVCDYFLGDFVRAVGPVQDVLDLVVVAFQIALGPDLADGERELVVEVHVDDANQELVAVGLALHGEGF